ncbi:MAG: 50S ribosomal protein L15 [Proteobacteria bacterium]|jgi:large subunit ribosomal protein L15|nr:50S ribosomal protein L15 [Pseudomonadota bacterium]NLN61639.1 50S ribosomal protein L15 [Myxococcales bacterium]
MSDILSKLAPPPGSRKKAKRLGRGPGSGLGKTSGKGQKGQRSRSGAGNLRGFEGGQMPLQRRLPKRGFKNPFRVVFEVVNLGSLERFDAGAVVDLAALVEAGLVSKKAKAVKILAKGDLTKKLTLKADAISGQALEKLTSLGGSFEELRRNL